MGNQSKAVGDYEQGRNPRIREQRMGIKQLEAAVLAEAKIVTGNKKLRMKDIMEWSTGEVTPQEGEKLHRLPELGVNIAVKIS